MRLSKLDRQVLDQSVLIDDDDQHQLIDSMLFKHQESAAIYRFWCFMLLLTQIIIVSFLQFYAKHSSIRLFALFVSLAMLFASVYGFNNILLLGSVTFPLERLLKIVNLGVCVLMMREFFLSPISRTFCLLPIVNLIVVWLYEDYIRVGSTVKHLKNLTYKYKSA